MTRYLPTRFPREYKDLYYDDFKSAKRWLYDGRKYITGVLNDKFRLSCFISSDIFSQTPIPELKSNSSNTTIRLIDCICQEANVFKNILKPATRKRESVITPSYVVIAKSNNPQFRKVQSITGYLPGFDEWLGIKLTDFNYSTFSFDNTKRVRQLDLIEGYVVVYIHSELVPDYTNNIAHTEQFRIYNDPRATVRFLGSPQDFTFGISAFSMLESFSNFLFSASYQNNIFTHSPDGSDNAEFIYAKVLGKRKSKDKFYRGPLFTINDLSDKSIANNILKEWIINYAKIQNSVESILLHLDNNISEDMKFISLIGALESLHRHFFEKKKDPGNEWSKIRQNILDSIVDEAYRDIVKKRLAGPIEDSLGRRLRDIVRIGKDYGLQTFDNSDIHAMVNTRNYYAHRDENGKQKALSGWRLIRSNLAIVKLIKLLILKIIKIPDPDLKNIVSRSHQFRY